MDEMIQKEEEVIVPAPPEISGENPKEDTEKDDAYFKGLIEAILFIEAEPVPLKRLSEVLGLDAGKVQGLIDDIRREQEHRRSGIRIVEVASGLRLGTNPVFGDFLKTYYQTRHKQKFSKSSLETLAIIAYKQPITRGEIEDVRGVSSDNAVKDLLEKELIRIVGRKKVPGNPIQYGTSREFLEFFGLKDLRDLPTLKELKELHFD